MFSDAQLVYPSVAEARLKASKKWPVYFYLMTHYNPEYFPKEVVNGRKLDLCKNIGSITLILYTIYTFDFLIPAKFLSV